RWAASEAARGQAERARALAETRCDEHQARLDLSRAVTNSLDEGVVALERSENAQHFLADASAALGASLDYEQTVETVVRLAIPSLADVCCLDLIAEGGESARAEVAFASQDPRTVEQLQRVLLESAWREALATAREGGQALLWHALPVLPSEGRALIKSHADSHRGPDTASLMTLPLRARGRSLGLLALGSFGSGRRYSTADLAFAEELAHRASMALDNARLHRQTERAVRQRQDVLAVVSHDLRTPLGTIMLGATLLTEEPDGDDPSGARLKTIATVTRAVAQMDRLLKDLLDMSSIDAGHLSLDRQPYALGPLVEDAFETLRPLTARKLLRFETRTKSPEVMLTCDRWRVVQVLSNLVGNAIKFSPEGGTIELRAEPRERDVRFAVTDGGPGIASDRLPYVFERYWQATETASKGTGLGLYICKGIVEAHGGTVGVESQPGRGSTFFFTLPLCPPPADETVTSAEPFEDEEPAPRSTERPDPPPSLWPLLPTRR
nr:ATP-binding protein [Polyangiaceae bacterium]